MAPRATLSPRTRDRLAVLAIVGAMLVVPSDPASASNFGATGTTGSNLCGFMYDQSGWQPIRQCVSRANNKWHAVFLNAVGGQWPGMDTAVSGSLSSDYNPTDLSAYVDQSDPYPDVIVYDYNYGNNGYFGWTDCPEDNTGIGNGGSLRWCRGQKVRFNGSVDHLFVNTSSARKGLACHELGHTVGIRHRDNPGSCSHGEPIRNGAGLYYFNAGLASHEQSHINSAY